MDLLFHAMGVWVYHDECNYRSMEGSLGKEAGTVGQAWGGLDSNYFPTGTHVTKDTSQG